MLIYKSLLVPTSNRYRLLEFVSQEVAGKKQALGINPLGKLINILYACLPFVNGDSNDPYITRFVI